MLYKMGLSSNIPDKKDLDKAYTRTQEHIKGHIDLGFLFTSEGPICERDIVYKVVSHLKGNMNPKNNGSNGYTKIPKGG